MMQTVINAFPRSAPAANAGIGTGLRRIVGQALQHLGRLVAPPRATDDAELPPEFFKYPPL
jgi:hypothetical protein